MSDLQENLRTEFQDEDYRYGYAESFLNTKLATQIKTLRQQRGKTQDEIAALMGIKQPGYRRFEDLNHSVWKTDTLWSIARAYGVRLNISFETFGTLLDEKERFNKEALQRPEFKDDQAFNQEEKVRKEQKSLADAMAKASEYLENVERSNGWASRLQNAQDAIDLGKRYPILNTVQPLIARPIDPASAAKQPSPVSADSRPDHYQGLRLILSKPSTAITAVNPIVEAA